MSTTPDHFPTDVEGLPEAHAPERVELSDGDEFNLRIGPVAKRIGDDTVRMLAYNDSIPGPVLEVRRAPRSSSTSRTRATWRPPSTGTGCGSRTATTARTRRRRRSRSASASRRRWRSRIPGAYWYHPHIREDYGQELGLYGNCSSSRPTRTTGRPPTGTCR